MVMERIFENSIVRLSQRGHELQQYDEMSAPFLLHGIHICHDVSYGSYQIPGPNDPVNASLSLRSSFGV